MSAESASLVNWHVSSLVSSPAPSHCPPFKVLFNWSPLATTGMMDSIVNQKYSKLLTILVAKGHYVPFVLWAKLILPHSIDSLNHPSAVSMPLRTALDRSSTWSSKWMICLPEEIRDPGIMLTYLTPQDLPTIHRKVRCVTKCYLQLSFTKEAQCLAFGKYSLPTTSL